MRYCVVIALLFVAACDATAPTDHVVGIYELETINGVAPPFSDTTPTYQRVFTANTIALNGDGTYVEIQFGRLTQDGRVTPIETTLSGTYTHDGETVRLIYFSGGQFWFTPGSVSRGGLTLFRGGGPSIYRRLGPNSLTCAPAFIAGCR